MNKAQQLAVGIQVLLTFGTLRANENNDSALEQPIQEFFFAETVYSQNKGEMQFTSIARLSGDRAFRQNEFALHAEYGFTDRLQVAAEIPYLFLHRDGGVRQSGIGDVQAGLLYNFLPGNVPFALSASLEMGLPTGDAGKDLGEGRLSWEPSLIIAKAFGQTQVHCSVGCEANTRQAEFFYGVAGVIPWGQWRGTLELTGSINQEHRLRLTPGVVWKASPVFEAGVGVGAGLTKDTPVWAVVVQFTFEFDLSKKDRRKGDD